MGLLPCTFDVLEEYSDNLFRFALFSLAALEALGFQRTLTFECRKTNKIAGFNIFLDSF